MENEVTRIDKNGDEIISNLDNNLSKGIHKIECKHGHDDRKCETCGIKYKYSDCFLK